MRKQQDISWAQLSVEGVAILISILLAFAIQAWWDQRQEEEEQVRLLTALSIEMTQNAQGATDFSQRKAAQAAILETMINALDSVPEGTPVNVSRAQLRGSVGSGTYGARRAAFDALVLSGQLRFIENDLLRQEISKWPSLVEDAVENEQQIREVWMPKLVQRLIQDVSLAQIFEPLCPQEGAEACSPPELIVSSDTEVIGLLVMTRMYLLEAEKELAWLAETTASLVEMIDAELE